MDHLAGSPPCILCMVKDVELKNILRQLEGLLLQIARKDKSSSSDSQTGLAMHGGSLTNQES